MAPGHMVHLASFDAPSDPSFLAAAVGVHSLAYFLVVAAVAIVVYEKLGLALLRRAWFNLDLLWAVALMAAGAIVLVMT